MQMLHLLHHIFSLTQPLKNLVLKETSEFPSHNYNIVEALMCIQQLEYSNTCTKYACVVLLQNIAMLH